ncbi:hypothetical protein F383_13244 [Gossypium arboreum]|uniref:Uncharacterized protein n=1 Tax=Gossypium arboreum TaxID=29729 RepID=A0A0B0NE45_GOSAR|nr:hypothetical protein F383_13244 [Gossypium arboreum]
MVFTIPVHCSMVVTTPFHNLIAEAIPFHLSMIDVTLLDFFVNTQLNIIQYSKINVER